MAKKNIDDLVDFKVSKDDLALVVFDTAFKKWEQEINTAFLRVEQIYKEFTKIAKTEAKALLDPYVSATDETTSISVERNDKESRNYFCLPQKYGSGNRGESSFYYDNLDPIAKLKFSVTFRKMEIVNKIKVKTEWTIENIAMKSTNHLIKEYNSLLLLLATPSPVLKDVRKSLAISAIKSAEGGDNLLKTLSNLVTKPLALPAPKE